jgi:hypothetical protein
MATYRAQRGERTTIYGCAAKWRDAVTLVWTASVVEDDNAELARQDAQEAAGEPVYQDLLLAPIPETADYDTSRSAAEWLLSQGCPAGECGRMVRAAAEHAELDDLARIQIRGVRSGETPIVAGLRALGETVTKIGE